MVVLLALLAVAGLKSYRDLEAARAQETLIQQRIEATQVTIRGLSGRVDRLREDPAMLERLAREDLGMVRPGDVILVLPEEPPETPPTEENAPN